MNKRAPIDTRGLRSERDRLIGPRTDLYIDTDMGADDALAISIALNSYAKVPVISTVHGNVSVEQAVENLARLLPIVGMQVDEEPPLIVRGAERPSIRAPISAASVFGIDGLGGVTAYRGSDASLLYPRGQVRLSGTPPWVHWPQQGDASKQQKLVALGPLTNLAKAIDINQDVLSPFDEVLIMGGNISGHGNITPYAEFNFYSDPDAAARVISKLSTLRLVPLEITSRVVLHQSVLEHAAVVAGHRGRFFRDCHKTFLAWYHANRGLSGCHPHDAVVISAALFPDAFEFRELEIDVELDPNAKNYGQVLVPGGGRHRVMVCSDIDVHFVTSIIEKYLTEQPSLK